MRFTRWRRRRFFALLAESGNVRMAAELAGVGLGCVYRLRRVETGFTERMVAAREVANSVLRDTSSTGSAAPQDERTGLVIRRGRGGHLRVMAAGPHWWEARHDAIFLGHLAATGNVAYAAQATGFTPKVAHDRRKARPDFAAGWEKALAVSCAALERAVEAEAQAAAAAADAIIGDKEWMPTPDEIDAAIRAVQRRDRAQGRVR